MEHTFDIAGTYNVDLTVIDSTGQSASDSILIVEPPPTPPASTTRPTFSEPPIIEEPE
jgi:PKD repeat protein